MKRTVTTARIINNKSSVPPLYLNLSQTSPIYRTALAAGQLALVGSGGAGGYTYSATGLPAGLSLNTATGAITGTPTTIGHNVITATVTDSATNTFTATFSVDVQTRLSITGAIQPTIELGVSVSNQLSTTGQTGTVSWSFSGSLQTGLSFSSGGLLSGTPSGSPGTFGGTVTATDSGSGDTASFAFLQLTLPALSVTHSFASAIPINAVAAGTTTWNYGGIIVPGHAPNYVALSVSVAGLPGVTATIEPTAGSNVAALKISGTTAGTCSITITATDFLGAVATDSFSVVIFSPNQILQPQKSAANVGPPGPSILNFEFPSSGTPDVANDGVTMTVTIPTVAGATGPAGHGSTTTTAAPTASGGNWVFTVGDTTAFNAASLPIYCSDGTNSIHGHVNSVASSTQLTVAPDSTVGTVSSIANGSTFTFSGVAGTGGGSLVDIRRTCILRAF